MKIFEKILLGFLILVFIGSFLIPVFIGTFSFYSFFDALTNTLLWGIPCLFIWVIVKIFIYFTKKKEKTEKTKKIEETEKVKKTENISKKIITLVLIFLIVINTTYWLNVTIKAKVLRPTILLQDALDDALRRVLADMERKGEIPAKRIDWSKYKTGGKTEEEAQRVIPKSDSFTTVMITNFARTGNFTMPLVFLAIIDVVLIAMYFMIIPLYKKEQ